MSAFNRRDSLHPLAEEVGAESDNWQVLIDQSKVHKAKFGWSQNHSIRVQGPIGVPPARERADPY